MLALLLAAAAGVIEGVEERYNRARTLRVQFEERVSYGGRTRREERGTLYLLRPGRMRWEYTQPAGKLFVADGKMFYLYSPYSNQVQRIKPREAADWRAPLAFLLGRLEFAREFGSVLTRPAGEGVELVARPRSDRDPFNEVRFLVAPRTFEIRRITISGQDGTVTEFAFSGESVNLPLEARLFRFQPPPGVEMVEGTP